MNQIRPSLWEQAMMLSVAEAPKLPPRSKRRIVVIVFQKGATQWGFQFGHFWWYVNYPSYWITCGVLGSHGIDKGAY